MNIETARPIEIPTESQYRFHVDHFAPVAGTRSVRYASSSLRPASSLRSILAKVPLSMSISTTSYVYMCTSGNLLHVRVVLRTSLSATADRVRCRDVGGRSSVVGGWHRVRLLDIAHGLIVKEDPVTRVSVTLSMERCFFRGNRRQIVPDTCVTVFLGDEHVFTSVSTGMMSMLVPG